MNWLELICSEKNLTLYELAKKSKLHHSVIYNIIKRNSKIENINLSTMESLCNGLEMTYIEFIDEVYKRFKA